MNTAKKGAVAAVYFIMAALVAVGLGVGIVRMLHGLGVSTNLSDRYPWGLWIVYDVLFVPIAAGAFMLLIVTHFFGRKEYHSITRPVVLAGFLGEVMVIAVLVMDLGRWHQFYNTLIPWYWNMRSFMFQVSICLTIYMGVMVLEVAPVILERFNWQKPLRLIKSATILIAGAGIVLSTLHQSSLGSLFLLMPYKLHPLWWTQLLPLLFFVSAAFSGLAMAILVTVLSFRAFRRHLELKLLSDLAKGISILLGIYLALKVGDILVAGEAGMMFTEGSLSLLFLTEMGIGVILPIILFSIRKVRERDSGLILGATCVLLGLALNRVSVALVAHKSPGGAAYFPHWMEVVIAAAAVAAGILIFTLALRLLPVLPGGDESKQRLLPAGWPRWSMILIGGVLVLLTIGMVLWLEPTAQAEALKMMPPSAPPQQGYLPPNSQSCRDCHADPASLREAGVDEDELPQMIIERRPLSMPHGRLGCVTCHAGADGTQDVEAAHKGLIVDLSETRPIDCVLCHNDMPDVFPDDRLKTPHGRIIDNALHRQSCDVHCSDCHGGVGHGFDPVSGEVICSMSVCSDCHEDRNLEIQMTDCEGCHIGPHDVSEGLACDDCHASLEKWSTIEAAVHPEFSQGKHAEPSCLECHTWPNFQDLQGTGCVTCHEQGHEKPSDTDCAKCHEIGVDWELTNPDAIDHTEFWNYSQGAHALVDCQGCHLEGRYLGAMDPGCANCHALDKDTCDPEKACIDCHLSDKSWSDIN